MVDTRLLSARGCSAADWEKLFKGRQRTRPYKKDGMVPKDASKSDKIEDLRNRIWNRIVAGRDWNFANYTVIHAMDLIWDAPFRQVSPTLISAICEKHGKNTAEVKNILSSLGLNFDSILVDTGQKDVHGKAIQTINVPSFFAVMVPLVRAYLTIRRAKVVNDRNREPFFEYKAATQSRKNRVRCEVLTSRIQDSAKAYDYLGTLNQAVFQMFLYPTGCLVFTKEEWDTVEQEHYGKDKKVEKFIVREGLRYHTPHPSRTFWDFSHPMRTFNTDTGCEFAGYWQIMRYGDIFDNPGFYNKDQIGVGNTAWFGSFPTFCSTVYTSCTLKLPTVSLDGPEEDREQLLADSYYSMDMRDKGVMVCEYREKLNPKQWGLGDYDHDIWCRFVVAGDGAVIYAAPMGYTPVCTFRDNGDEKRISDASLALQLAPFQDQLSNLFTQFLLAVKQNLANFTMVDKNVVDLETIKKLTNDGETYFRGLNIYPFDAKAMFRMQSDPKSALLSHRFPPLDTNGIVLAMKLVLDMAERVLQFSNQEVAQAASHEQTKKEVEITHESTNNIIEYTGVPIDAGLNAMAHQNYEALMNYGEDEFYAQIPSDHELKPEELTKLGISQDDDDKEETRDKKLRVRAKKSAVRLDAFATVPPSSKRTTNWEAAQAISQFFATTLNNPVIQMALGPRQMIDIANQIAKLAGLHFDAELRDMTDENQKKVAADVVKQATEAVLGIVRQETKEGLEVIMSQIKDLQNAVAKLIQMAGNAAQPPNPIVGPNGIVGPSVVAPLPAVPVIPAVAPNPMPIGAA